MGRSSLPMAIFPFSIIFACYVLVFIPPGMSSEIGEDRPSSEPEACGDDLDCPVRLICHSSICQCADIFDATGNSCNVMGVGSYIINAAILLVLLFYTYSMVLAATLLRREYTHRTQGTSDRRFVVGVYMCCCFSGIIHQLCYLLPGLQIDQDWYLFYKVLDADEAAMGVLHIFTILKVSGIWIDIYTASAKMVMKRNVTGATTAKTISLVAGVIYGLIALVSAIFRAYTVRLIAQMIITIIICVSYFYGSRKLAELSLKSVTSTERTRSTGSEDVNVAHAGIIASKTAAARRLCTTANRIALSHFAAILFGIANFIIPRRSSIWRSMAAQLAFGLVCLGGFYVLLHMKNVKGGQNDEASEAGPVTCRSKGTLPGEVQKMGSSSCGSKKIIAVSVYPLQATPKANNT